jgi:hypothetical protein
MPLAMIVKENKPALMNPAINKLSRKVNPRNQHQISADSGKR